MAKVLGAASLLWGGATSLFWCYVIDSYAEIRLEKSQFYLEFWYLYLFYIRESDTHLNRDRNFFIICYL